MGVGDAQAGASAAESEGPEQHFWCFGQWKNLCLPLFDLSSHSSEGSRIRAQDRASLAF